MPHHRTRPLHIASYELIPLIACLCPSRCLHADLFPAEPHAISLFVPHWLLVSRSIVAQPAAPAVRSAAILRISVRAAQRLSTGLQMTGAHQDAAGGATGVRCGLATEVCVDRSHPSVRRLFGRRQRRLCLRSANEFRCCAGDPTLKSVGLRRQASHPIAAAAPRSRPLSPHHSPSFLRSNIGRMSEYQPGAGLAALG